MFPPHSRFIRFIIPPSSVRAACFAVLSALCLSWMGALSLPAAAQDAGAMPAAPSTLHLSWSVPATDLTAWQPFDVTVELDDPAPSTLDVMVRAVLQSSSPVISAIQSIRIPAGETMQTETWPGGLPRPGVWRLSVQSAEFQSGVEMIVLEVDASTVNLTLTPPQVKAALWSYRRGTDEDTLDVTVELSGAAQSAVTLVVMLAQGAHGSPVIATQTVTIAKGQLQAETSFTAPLEDSAEYQLSIVSAERADEGPLDVSPQAGMQSFRTLLSAPEYLKEWNADAGHGFGGAVAVDGDWLAAASANQVHLYQKDAQGKWLLRQSIAGPSADAEFGAALAMVEGVLAVGAPGAEKSGRVYAYHLNSRTGEWGAAVSGPLRADDEHAARFGESLAMTKADLTGNVDRLLAVTGALQAVAAPSLPPGRYEELRDDVRAGLLDLMTQPEDSDGGRVWTAMEAVEDFDGLQQFVLLTLVPYLAPPEPPEIRQRAPTELNVAALTDYLLPFLLDNEDNPLAADNLARLEAVGVAFLGDEGLLNPLLALRDNVLLLQRLAASGEKTVYMFERAAVLFGAFFAWTSQGQPQSGAQEGLTGVEFGASVSLEGLALAVGVPRLRAGTETVGETTQTVNWMRGGVQMYEYVQGSPNTWTARELLRVQAPPAVPGLTEGEGLGVSVSLTGDGSMLAAGAPGLGEGGRPGNGLAFIFHSEDGRWNTATVTAELSQGEREGDGSWDAFGAAVAFSGDTLAVGAPWETASFSRLSDQARPGVGAVYVFRSSATASGPVWPQDPRLRAGNPGRGDFFGAALALSDNTLAVGAPGEDGDRLSREGAYNNRLKDSGAVYMHDISLQAPAVADGDGDGVSDALETALGTNATEDAYFSKDGDIVPDIVELYYSESHRDRASTYKTVVCDAGAWRTRVLSSCPESASSLLEGKLLHVEMAADGSGVYRGAAGGFLDDQEDGGNLVDAFTRLGAGTHWLSGAGRSAEREIIRLDIRPLLTLSGPPAFRVTGPEDAARAAYTFSVFLQGPLPQGSASVQGRVCRTPEDPDFSGMGLPDEKCPAGFGTFTFDTAAQHKSFSLSWSVVQETSGRDDTDKALQLQALITAGTSSVSVRSVSRGALARTAVWSPPAAMDAMAMPTLMQLLDASDNPLGAAGNNQSWIFGAQPAANIDEVQLIYMQKPDAPAVSRTLTFPPAMITTQKITVDDASLLSVFADGAVRVRFYTTPAVTADHLLGELYFLVGARDEDGNLVPDAEEGGSVDMGLTGRKGLRYSPEDDPGREHYLRSSHALRLGEQALAEGKGTPNLRGADQTLKALNIPASNALNIIDGAVFAFETFCTEDPACLLPGEPARLVFELSDAEVDQYDDAQLQEVRYYKYRQRTNDWRPLITTAEGGRALEDGLAFAMRDEQTGECPAPGDAAYAAEEGEVLDRDMRCVQLTITDNGPNDDNPLGGVIADPGFLGAPPAAAGGDVRPPRSRSGGGGAAGWPLLLLLAAVSLLSLTARKRFSRRRIPAG